MLTLKLGLAAIVVLAMAQAYTRLSPLPAERLAARPGPMQPGVHPSADGVKLVTPLAALPPDALARLVALIEATPRTRRLGPGDNPAAFVTRSRLWGFPDIAVVWVEAGMLHIDSRLVIGRGDLGVNAARVARWMAALEAET